MDHLNDEGVDAFWQDQCARLLPEGAGADGGDAAEALREKILEHSANHERPLAVVGVFSKAGTALSASGLVDQLCLRQSGGLAGLLGANGSAAKLGSLQVSYRDQENILYLCLDSAAAPGGRVWLEGPEAEGDPSFLARFAKAEIAQVTELALLFNLCHMVLWLCPGSSPRVDSESLRLLDKLSELQASNDLADSFASRPVRRPPCLMFVYGDLKLPFRAHSPDAPTPSHVIATVEKGVEAKWRACLKKYLYESKSSGLFRLPRRLVSVLPDPLASLDPGTMLDLVVEMEGLAREPSFCSAAEEAALFAVANEPSAMDLCRTRVLDAVEQLREEALCSSTLRDWLQSAGQLRQGVMACLGPAQTLPKELRIILEEDAPSSPTEPTGGRKTQLSKQLFRWAFAEILFSLNSAQKGFEDGSKAYRDCMKKLGSTLVAPEAHEQQVRSAQQALQQKACAPLHTAAAAALQAGCDLHFASKRICPKKSLTGHPCILLDGHSDDHRSSFRLTRVCLCGKTLMHRNDSFTATATPAAALPPSASCCHNVRFLPFMPLSCDFVPDPVFVPPSPRLAKSRPGREVTTLPSALPDAGGFVALVADSPVKVDPTEGSRLPGFTDSFQHLNRWRLPSKDPLGLTNAPVREAFVGFEYLCPQGYRFYVPPLKNSGLMLNSVAAAKASRREKRRREKAQVPHPPAPQHAPALPGLLEEGEFEVAPLCSYRLFASCVKHARGKRMGPEESGKHCGDPLCVAQLTRIWVQTPSAGKAGELIEAAPRVSMVDPRGKRGADGQLPEVTCSGGKVTLPHDSLVELVLPTTYMAQEADGTYTALPSFWDLTRAEAERCRLLPYTFWVSTPT